MANFRVYPGRWLKAVSEVGEIKKDQIVQVLNCDARFASIFTFVGIHGTFELNSKNWIPIDSEEKLTTKQN